MPAADSIHDEVVRALQKGGWTITHDPLTIEYGESYLFVDLGASKTVTAQRGAERIAVEIKSFPGKSRVTDLQQAVGQYAVYRVLLREVEPTRVLYLAVSDEVYRKVFESGAGALVRADLGVKLVVVNIEAEEVVRWLS
jgi:XisH protein